MHFASEMLREILFCQWDTCPSRMHPHLDYFQLKAFVDKDPSFMTFGAHRAVSQIMVNRVIQCVPDELFE